MNGFVDYYEDLQVSPNADAETIDRIYRLLARRWHPDNQSTGDSEKFNIISEAYKRLSDPKERAAYDVNYEAKKSHQWQAFSQILPSEKGVDDEIRNGILSILYFARRQDTENPSVGIWRLEKLLGWPEKEIDFHLWYLKEKNWIRRTDSGGFEITAIGAEIVEERKFEQSQKLLTLERQAATDMQPGNRANC